MSQPIIEATRAELKWAIESLMDSLEQHATDSEERITTISVVWENDEYIAELHYS